MAIHQLFEKESKHKFTETFDPADAGPESKGKSPIFSTIITRICFALLLVADAFWIVYTTIFLLLSITLIILTGGKSQITRRLLKKSWLHFRRSLICALSLAVGLFCPPFGIMIACTYFLMYDKAGMEEVIPAALQAQVKDVFHEGR